MPEIKEKDDDLFGLLVPLIFLMFMVIGAAFFFFGYGWLPTLVALTGGLLWAVFSFRVVKPAFAGLMFRFGSRVSIGEGEYLTKKEGWTFIFPILERIVEISLRQHQEEINKQDVNESEDAYKNRAESFSTAEGVSIFSEIFFSYKVVNPGKVFELGGGIDENGDSPFLVEMLHNLVIGGTRGALARMELTKILSREIMDEGGNATPIGEKIRTDIISTPNFDRLGAEILIIRIEDIKFKQDAQDVLDALEDIKKKELSRQSQIIEADAKLQVKRKEAEAIVVTADANLAKARAEANGLNATIAAFVGKRADEKTSTEEGAAYARYQVGLAVAKSLETGTKVIIPAGDMSKMVAGLVNVFDASKP